MMPAIRQMSATVTLALLLANPGQGAETGPDAALAKAVASGAIPGAAALAAGADGLIFAGAAGKADLESGEPMRPDSIVRIASMTKAVTSVAIMQLVERGELALDTPAQDLLPRLADARVLDGFAADGTPILRAPASPTTIRQLLSHTSGYSYSVWNEDMARYMAEGHGPDMSEGLNALLSMPLSSDPGTRWEYSISTDLLGLVVEAVSGKSLGEYFQEHILGPLSMNDTFFLVPDNKIFRVATGYARSAEGALNPLPFQNGSAERQAGGGGLFSTGEDYLRFLRMLLGGGELDGRRILESQTVELMAQDQTGGLEAGGESRSTEPTMSNDFDFFPETRDSFGLGFLINRAPVPGGRAAGSLAWAGLYNTYFWIDRKSDVCGVVITQVLPFFDPAALNLLDSFEKAIYTEAR
jgi:methyl acetate hydrolase